MEQYLHVVNTSDSERNESTITIMELSESQAREACLSRNQMPFAQRNLDQIFPSNENLMSNPHTFSDVENREKRYCEATWDSIYCWPYTLAGKTLKIPCQDVMKEVPGINPTQLENMSGNAIRICADNGTWLWGNWTNYTECLDGLDDEDGPNIKQGLINRSAVDAVRWILFIGSILSFLCLGISLFIYSYFRCLRCDRVIVQLHLMLSLLIRFALLVIVAEPFIFQRTSNYRDVDGLCKTILFLLMYATVASINWMFIQGHYLHGRLTTNIFNRGTPFKLYYFIGWVLPLLLILSWTLVMETLHPVHCWKNYASLPYIWILVGPIFFALGINLLFLVNIMRILLTKIQRANTTNDSAQFRRAVKATAILFPLLGINNLLFVYNPGGEYEDLYMISNAILQSSQGILVSLLYCFISKDVRDAIRREYHRFVARRFAANQSMRRKSGFSNTNTTLLIFTPRLNTNGHRGTQKKRNGFRAIFTPKNPLPGSLTPSPETAAVSFYPCGEHSSVCDTSTAASPSGSGLMPSFPTFLGFSAKRGLKNEKLKIREQREHLLSSPSHTHHLVVIPLKNFS